MMKYALAAAFTFLAVPAFAACPDGWVEVTDRRGTPLCAQELQPLQPPRFPADPVPCGDGPDIVLSDGQFWCPAKVSER